MTRSMVLSLLVVIFSLTTSMIINLGVLPNVQSMDQVGLNQAAVSEITSPPTVGSGSDNTGYMGYFNISIKVLMTIVNVIIGVLVVAVPLISLGVPWPIATMIQGVLYALIGLDQYSLWRGGTY